MKENATNVMSEFLNSGDLLARMGLVAGVCS